MKVFILLIFFLLLSCNNYKSENQIEINTEKEISKNELLFKNWLIKKQKTILKKLNLNDISKLNSKTLRIWRFPGGGAVFQEIYELNIDKEELKLYSSLIENVNSIETKELSKLEYQKVIKNKELTENLIKFSKEKSILKFKNIEEYCKNHLGCGDSFLIEYKDNLERNTFSIDEGIKKCQNKNTESPKQLLELIEKMVFEYGN
ncbi:hypothetical protein [Flavobacterium sp.]|uniref:hypothetical protein n=1 Tax=Flavobacterium sp. TaxID=239 RepID=UPI0026348D2C|nr:hypothetical protein [Flavobacterium sp.]